PIRVAAALRAVLDNDVMLPRQLHGDAAFPNVVAARLFNIDVFACLSGPDRHQGVPVIGRGDGDGIDVAVLQGAAYVLHFARLVAAAPLDFGRTTLKGAHVRIDKIGDLHALHAGELADVLAAAAVEPGNADAQHLVGAEHAAGR